MTVPPNDPRHDQPDTSEQAALPEGGAGKTGAPRVVDVEILHDHEGPRNDGQHTTGQGNARAQGNGWNTAPGFGPFEDGADAGSGQAESGRQEYRSRFFYRGTLGQAGGLGGMNLGRVWMGGNDQSGCLAASVTFALFMVCLAQFGFLAGIGFVFFHIIGTVMGVMRDLRQFSAGRLPNPWTWRIGNWAVSFLLTAWFAGAFD